jgi:ADP-heptose:LPS heptosyltransferase
MLDVRLDDERPEIHLSDTEKLEGKRRVEGFARPIAMQVVTSSTYNKLWPMDRWAALVESCPGVQFLQLGEAGEPLIPGAVDLRGLTLRQSFAVIRQCAALVGCDSAFAHAAAAFGVPAVVLFGPTTPSIWGHPSAINLYAGLRCSPCIDTLFDGECPYDRRCMHAILVPETRRALLKVLEATACAATSAEPA